jgi:cellulose synthase/poly-beta-1,6-N-acetylglucosamine synthase-like glycosyltransferase
MVLNVRRKGSLRALLLTRDQRVRNAPVALLEFWLFVFSSGHKKEGNWVMSYVLGLVTNEEKPALTFVVPLKDEQATIGDLFNGIALEASKITDQWEVVFVDDGSTDKSWEVIECLASQNRDRIKALRFRRNAGKAAALAAGWKSSKGDIIFTMDADLQDDPQ